MATTGFFSRLFGRSSTDGHRLTPRASKKANATAANHADSPPASSYEGQLLRGERTAPVYKIENGRKRWIVTEEVFLRNGFSWADVHVVPGSTVDSIPSGDNIT